MYTVYLLRFGDGTFYIGSTGCEIGRKTAWRHVLRHRGVPHEFVVLAKLSPRTHNRRGMLALEAKLIADAKAKYGDRCANTIVPGSDRWQAWVDDQNKPKRRFSVRRPRSR